MLCDNLQQFPNRSFLSLEYPNQCLDPVNKKPHDVGEIWLGEGCGSYQCIKRGEKLYISTAL